MGRRETQQTLKKLTKAEIKRKESRSLHALWLQHSLRYREPQRAVCSSHSSQTPLPHGTPHILRTSVSSKGILQTPPPSPTQAPSQHWVPTEQTLKVLGYTENSQELCYADCQAECWGGLGDIPWKCTLRGRD